MRRLTTLALFAAVMAACSDNPTATVRKTPTLQPTTSSTPISAPIPGQYIVVFKNNVLNVAAMASTIASAHNTKSTHTYTTALKGVAVALSDAEADAMRADPSVAYVEQDQVVKLTSVQANAPWGLDRTDQRTLPLSTTYSSTADGTGVTAYVMDTGIYYANTEFGGRAVPGADFVSPSLNGDDCVGHGTAVASVIGGTTYGVAKKVMLVSLRVADCALAISSSRVIAAIDWIATHPSKPSVVNMSMQLNKSTAVTQAVQNSINSGVVYAVAAGNTADDACNWSPANVPAALTVGASDANDAFASWSSYGSCVDIAAPGSGIPTAWIGSPTATHSGGGTSFSTPHVAGVAALYLQLNRTATPAQVTAAITSNATSNVLTGVPANTPNRLLYSGFLSGSPAPPPTNQPPVARYTVTCPTLRCTFDASTSTDDIGIVSYTWTWGDGRAETHVGAVANNSYAAPSTYRVMLTVTDGSGQTNSVTQSVQVPTASAPTNLPPLARFTWTCGAAGSHNCTVNGSTSTDDVAVVSYTWNWGNGKSETHSGSSSSNTWATSGTYDVTLTVKDGGGLAGSVTKAVVVP